MSLEDLYYVVMIVAAFSAAAFALGYHIGKAKNKYFWPIATFAKASCKHELLLIVRVNTKK